MNEFSWWDAINWWPFILIGGGVVFLWLLMRGVGETAKRQQDRADQQLSRADAQQEAIERNLKASAEQLERWNQVLDRVERLVDQVEKKDGAG